MRRFLFLTALVCISFSVMANVINVGSGSYTTTHPGYDAAGRNSYPAGTPQVSGNAADRPIPTNDWWSALLNQNHVSNLFPQPLTLITKPNGLVVSHIPSGVYDSLDPILIGTASLNAPQVTVSDYSDWTVTMNWTSGNNQLEATAGIGMPFVYLTKNSTEPISITVANRGTVTINNEMLIIEDAKLYSTADFVVYAPAGSTWTQSGTTYTSTLNDKNYLSVAMMPLSTTNVAAKAVEYKKYAYVFPTNTTANYTYNETTSVVRTTFEIETDVKEGADTLPLIGLLPHQWGNLTSDAPTFTNNTYKIIRGDLKTTATTKFTVENTFYGILPTLPAMGTLSPTYDVAELNALINPIKDETLAEWTDSYNDGQLLNRLIQTARVAAEIGNTTAFNAIKASIKERTEDWLSYSQGEVAFLFYYVDQWTTLVGYPAGHSQDSNLNDHHFHWGYFIHAAAFLEQYEPGWAAQWGDMVNLLVRDAASSNRNDDMFPYLRNFSPYHGHCWANGFATFPQGNDQESTSESMQFNSALIHWGTITGNDSIRDLGIYLYTTEQTAVEEYWFDVNDRTFTAAQQYSLVSRVWGNSMDNGTFWTGDIAASYGIELYPIHGGSLYLGHQKEYIKKLWNEIKANTGITRNEVNDNLWHDTMWKFAAFVDPAEALSMHDSYPDRNLKFGMSSAQTYYWLHSMVALGEVSAEITANYPVATVFNQKGRKTYVAQNYSSQPITVSFSDGYQMQVPANTLYYEQDGEALPQVSITSPKASDEIYVGDTVLIQASAVDYEGEDIVEVSFYIDGALLATSTTAPYQVEWNDMSEGIYTITATTKNSAGKEGESKEVVVNVVTAPIVTDTPCSSTSSEALQGAFSTGYSLSFSTVGTSVTLKAQLLDTDRSGVVAYMWEKSPFSEKQMTSLGDQTFEVTVNNLTVGEEITWAVKFAYAGGMSVTSYFTYTVGNNCDGDDGNGGSTDVENVEGEDEIVWSVNNGLLTIDCCYGEPLAIYNISGICVYRTDALDKQIITMNNGVYILQVGDKTVKIVVQ